MLSSSFRSAVLVLFKESYDISLLVFKQCSLIVIVKPLKVLSDEPIFIEGLFLLLCCITSFVLL